MNLIANIHEDWLDVMQIEKHMISNLSKSLGKLKVIAPKEHSLLFLPFEFCHPNQIKVIILGQNPYPTSDVATGLPFDINSNSKMPPSLSNILKKLKLEYNISTESKFISLKEWAKQGVLLVNIEPFLFSPKEKKGHIDTFLGSWKHILKSVLNFYKSLPIIIWGNKARSFMTNENICLENPIYGVHPSPLSAYRGFFKKDYFLTANKILHLKGKEQINWLKAIIY